MADLIELDVVVRQKGLKESLSTVERLERQLTKAAKAIEQNRISQDRYNKILLSAKRQYEALGVSSQKATASVRKFADSQRAAMGTTDNLTNSIKRQTEAQMAATKQSNRMGVVTQQAGYQVSDFIVQVQSGTNVFVAFGQQASQLVGILPLMASSIGLTTGAAIALSAALGIIIPLATAVGAAFLRAKETSADAGDALYTFKEASTAAAQEVKSLTIESYMLSKGIESSKVAMLDFAISAQEAKTAANDLANEASILFGPNGIFELGGGFTVLGFEIVKTDEEKLALLRDQRDTILDQNEQIRVQKANKQTLIDIEKAHNKYLEEQKEAQKELDGFTIDILESLRRRNQLAQAYLDGGKEAVEKEQQLHDNMDLTAQIQEKLLAVESMTNEEREAAEQAILRQVKAIQDLEGEVKAAKIETEELEQAAKDAAAAFEKMSGFSEGLDEKIAVAAAELEALGSGGSSSIAKTVAQLNYQADALYETKKATGELTQADRNLYVETKAQIAAYNAALVLIEDKEAAIKAEEKATREAAKAYKLQLQEAEKLRKELEGPMVTAVGTVSDAFGNFIARGLTDFKGFVKQILASFQNMIAQMIAMAVRNRIMLSLGIGGITPAAAAAGQVAGLGTASTMLGSIGTGTGFAGIAGGTGFLGGAANTISGLAGGGAGIFNVAGNAAMAGGGAMATIGAAMPLVAAGFALFSLFKKKPAISPENMNKVNQALKMTGQVLDGTGKEAQKAAAALGEVAGGFDNLTKKAQAYFESFYTEGERRAIAVTEATQALNKTFADLEMAVPKTHSEFRQLVEAQDLMTEEGRKTYNSLLDVSSAFVTLNGTVQEAAERAATLRQEELALREARSLAQLQPFIGEEASAATLERLSAQVYSGNIKSLVDGVFQEIFEALTPDATQMGKITPYLEELTEQLEEVVKNLSATDDILRKYASGDIIGEIRKFTKQMQREIRYLVDFSGGTPEGIAFGVFNSVKRAAQDITRIAKEMSRDLGTIFTEFAAEFKVENVLDESRKVTDRIDELLSAFTATRDSLLSSYTKAVRAFDHAPNFDTTTRAGREAFEEAQQAGEALAEAQREIEKLTTTINTLSTSSRAFEQAVADKLVEPITEALTVYLPTALDNLPQDIKNTMGGLFAGITEGSLEGFQSAYVQLAELFTTNKITVDQFNKSFKIMEDTFRGNISLTDQYTTKQQTVIEKLSRAYEDFTSRLQNLLGVVQGGIDSLLGQATSANVVASRRGSQAYLRNVARTGEFDAGRLERAVGAVSGGDTAGFGSRQDFLRYVADTTNVLNAVKGTLEGQLDTLQMKQVKSILKIEETSTSSAESLQSIQSLLAEFLGVGGRVPSFAAGGYHSGGLRIVGERGPELEATGPSRIIPAGEFAVGGVSALRQEIAEMKDQLYNGLVQVAKYTRKSSETLNKFDYDGLPSDRGY